MKPNCPNKTCLSSDVKKDGSFYRHDDARNIQRFKCKVCKARFSSATLSPTYKQKKRRINPILFKLLCSGVSLRRSAEIINVTRNTITRRLIFFAKQARVNQEKLLAQLQNSLYFVQLDDLITIEHTKLKPLSVSVAVDSTQRIILGAKVSKIAAFGHLAEVSRRKYGVRKSELPKALDELFAQIKKAVHPEVVIQSDEHRLYPKFIKKHFPFATHIQEESAPSAVTGQGELKKKKFDPLFSINHSLAMLRANINRLFRRTWCTTKIPERLQDHLDIYIQYHNSKILS